MKRSERIAAIKQAIQNGAYQVNVPGIVDGMLQRFDESYADDREDVEPARPVNNRPEEWYSED